MRAFRIDVARGTFDELAPESAGAPGALVWVDVDLTDLTHTDSRARLASVGLLDCPVAYYELVARWYAPDEPQFERVRPDFIAWDDAVLQVNRPGRPRMVRAPWIEVGA